MIKTLWRLSREAIRYRTLYIVAILSTLALTAVNLTAPKLLSSMTGIVETGINEEGLRTIGLLTAALVALYLAVSTKDPIYIAVTIAMAIAVVAVFMSYSGSRRKVYEMMDDDSTKTLEMTEEGVSYKDGKTSLKYKWEDISCVALNKRSITFFPVKRAMEPFFIDAE